MSRNHHRMLILGALPLASSDRTKHFPVESWARARGARPARRSGALEVLCVPKYARLAQMRARVYEPILTTGAAHVPKSCVYAWKVLLLLPPRHDRVEGLFGSAPPPKQSNSTRHAFCVRTTFDVKWRRGPACGRTSGGPLAASNDSVGGRDLQAACHRSSWEEKGASAPRAANGPPAT